MRKETCAYCKGKGKTAYRTYYNRITKTCDKHLRRCWFCKGTGILN